jgi:hypothetical protein
MLMPNAVSAPHASPSQLQTAYEDESTAGRDVRACLKPHQELRDQAYDRLYTSTASLFNNSFIFEIPVKYMQHISNIPAIFDMYQQSEEGANQCYAEYNRSRTTVPQR